MKPWMRLARLCLTSSWPPRRDKMVYDDDWVLWISDLWRVTVHGVPSIFD